MTRFEGWFGGAVEDGGKGELAGSERLIVQDQLCTRDRNVGVEGVSRRRRSSFSPIAWSSVERVNGECCISRAPCAACPSA